VLLAVTGAIAPQAAIASDRPPLPTIVARATAPDVPTIAPTDLKAAIDRDRDSLLIVDVRSPKEYASGHLDGAMLVPLDELKDGRGIETVRSALGDRQLVTYCTLGVRGAKAIAILEEAGLEGKSLAGGLQAWKDAIGTTNPIEAAQ